MCKRMHHCAQFCTQACTLSSHFVWTSSVCARAHGSYFRYHCSWMSVKRLASGVHLPLYTLWTLFYSRKLPKNREEHSCGTFWHSYLWCSCCLVLDWGGQKGAKERKEEEQRGQKRERLRGDIHPEGIYSARQPCTYITCWQAEQVNQQSQSSYQSF